LHYTALFVIVMAMNNKSIVRFTVVVAALAVIVGLAFAYTQIRNTRYYINDGAAMEPTISAGQELRATAVKPEQVSRGDIIILNSEFINGQQVRRVIGLPGDTVVIEDGAILVQIVDGSTYIPKFSKTPETEVAPKVVQPETYYVIGDNTFNSFDSRRYGGVPFSSYEATVDR